jgi:hypothetical protein
VFFSGGSRLHENDESPLPQRTLVGIPKLLPAERAVPIFIDAIHYLRYLLIGVIATGRGFAECVQFFFTQCPVVVAVEVAETRVASSSGLGLLAILLTVLARLLLVLALLAVLGLPILLTVLARLLLVLTLLAIILRHLSMLLALLAVSGHLAIALIVPAELGRLTVLLPVLAWLLVLIRLTILGRPVVLRPVLASLTILVLLTVLALALLPVPLVLHSLLRRHPFLLGAYLLLFFQPLQVCHRT